MNILFVVAHPDDDALGAGAYISRQKAKGDRVSVLTLSMTAVTRPDDLQAAQHESHKILGVDRDYFGNLEAMHFAEGDRYTLTRLIESVIAEEQPEAIFTHYPGDIHNDHRITSQLVKEAARLPWRGTKKCKNIGGIYFFEVPSSTDWGDGKFSPNAFANVSRLELDTKLKAIECYEDVLRPVPHPRNRESIYALARYRGGMSGNIYAEGFETALQNL